MSNYFIEIFGTREISILDLMSLPIALGLPDPGEPVFEKLRDILVDERQAWTGKHIRRAFEPRGGSHHSKVVCTGEYMRNRRTE
jgi:hypothetical protein